MQTDKLPRPLDADMRWDYPSRLSPSRLMRCEQAPLHGPFV